MDAAGRPASDQQAIGAVLPLNRTLSTVPPLKIVSTGWTGFLTPAQEKALYNFCDNPQGMPIGNVINARTMKGTASWSSQPKTETDLWC
jgi:hypothetical protein